MKTKILILWICLFIFSCETKPVQNDKSINPISDRELGIKFSILEKQMGKPSETNIEKYGSNSFKVLEYYNKNQHPSAFYTVDLNDIVISKSTWIQSEQKSANLSWLIQNQFPSQKFKNYVPCETSGDQKFLVDQEHGIFIGYQGLKVLFISQSSPELTTLRINQFKTKCPQLQE